MSKLDVPRRAYNEKSFKKQGRNFFDQNLNFSLKMEYKIVLDVQNMLVFISIKSEITNLEIKS